jgi:PAS domain S-box-containing protein
VCDAALRFDFANRMARSILGYEEPELARLTLGDLAHPEDADAVARLARERLEGADEAVCLERRYVRRDGRVVWCRTSLSPLPGTGALVVTLEDVSERRTTERKLRESERLVAVGTLAAGIAHEINNPIGSIMASAQLALMVKDDADGPQQAIASLHRIVGEARRCGQIVKSVLKFAREESTEKWPCDLDEIVRQTADHSLELVKRYGATLDLELAGGLPAVRANPMEMEQLIANLVRNSLQSGGYGIRVVVRTAGRPDCVLLSVADDGPGMPPEVREQIFDPFFTTRESSGGTGLGLSMVHGIVSGHGGKIAVHSEPGEGTEVAIELPLAPAPARRKER